MGRPARGDERRRGSRAEGSRPDGESGGDAVVAPVDDLADGRPELVAVIFLLAMLFEVGRCDVGHVYRRKEMNGSTSIAPSGMQRYILKAENGLPALQHANR